MASTLYSTTTIPNASPRSIQDAQANQHYLEIANQLYLDGQPATIEILAKEQLIRVCVASGPVLFDAAAFWKSFAGIGEPSAADAGMLMAQSLTHWAALQQLRGTYTALENALYQVLTQSEQGNHLHVPVYRLDPIVRAGPQCL